MLNNEQIKFLKPKLVYRLWGNDKLNKQFGDESVNNPGEAWIISAINDNESNLLNSNESFNDFFTNNKKFFDNYESDVYPLLTKIIATSQDLSIQVHPGNNYAKNFDSLGKTECWYVLDSQDGYIYTDANMPIENKVKAIKENDVMSVLNKWNVKEGDFYFINAQKIHAIGKNVKIFELQQSSDLTFRIDDFNRIDASTKRLRELHIDDACNAILSVEEQINTTKEVIDSNLELLTKNKYFSLFKLNNVETKDYEFNDARWIQVFVNKGKGTLNGVKICENNSLILHSDIKKLTISGDLQLMISYVNKN